MNVRVSENQTDILKDELEERKYGERLTSMELASHANVSLDDVSRFERHLPIVELIASGDVASGKAFLAQHMDEAAQRIIKQLEFAAPAAS